MRRSTRMMGVAAMTCAALAAGCGDGGDGDQTGRVAFSQMVVFGDSLSDVGSYATPGIVGATQGNGRFTVNNTTGVAAKIWVDHIAAQLGLPTPCAARVGLNSSGPLAGLAQTPVDSTDPACTGYAQGGARVTLTVGPGNAALPAPDGLLGQLTNPLIEQFQRHLTRVGSFSGTELVTVFAGGNDLIMNLAAVQQAGGTPQSVQAAGVAMATAGGELAQYIRQILIPNGAKHVLVINLPDVSLTPSARGTAAEPLALGLAQAYNNQLASGLGNPPEVIFVDAFTVSQTQAANPAQFGLTNVDEPVCDEALMLVPTALTCTVNTLIGGDTSHFLYADTVHPTPYGHQLIAQLVTQRLAQAGRI